MSTPNFNIELYLDGANKEEMLRFQGDASITGFTTNPTLMKKAGITDYEGFAKEILAEIKDKSISFEVFADDFPTMKEQALKIASWGDNVYVKIPISNTKGEMSYDLIADLVKNGVKVNATAIFTEGQLKNVKEQLPSDADIILSVFAGRIADTGVDPMPTMKNAVSMFRDMPNVKILWASPREALNIYQADECGCHIITATGDLLKKLSLYNKSLEEFSVETVQMFYNDGAAAGYQI